MTPYNKLKSPPTAKDYLIPDINFEILDKFAHQPQSSGGAATEGPSVPLKNHS